MNGALTIEEASNLNINNPYFPDLRSDPMALSGASRPKPAKSKFLAAQPHQVRPAALLTASTPKPPSTYS